MQDIGYIPDTANAIAQYFNKASFALPAGNPGSIVMDILNRKGVISTAKRYAPNC